MTPAIRGFAPDTEYFMTEGCHITELSNTPEDPDLSIARARVTPGQVTRWHRLRDTTERYVILEGCGKVELGNMEAQTVHPGDVVLIPPGCPQRIRNPGETDLIFLAICTPRFQIGVYEDVHQAIDNADIT